MTNREYASILNFLSAMIIVIGLPTGFYIVYELLDIIDQLKTRSFDIGEGFMKGLQSGVNETFVNELAKQIAQTIFANSIAEPIPTY